MINWTTAKLKTFPLRKTLLKGWKGKLQTGRKYLQSIYLTKGLYLESIFCKLSKLYIKKIVQLENGQNKWAEISSKRIYRWQISTRKKCSISLVIREMQIKTIMRYYYISTTMSKILIEQSKCWQGSEKPNQYCWWECNMVQPF